MNYGFGCTIFCRVNTFFLSSLKRNMAAVGSRFQSNRLKLEKSPYLLQHASNPVDWYPWGDEAFSAAKEQNKLIFLSVGYSTCHWCHVMEKESFENENIAKLMNENFINVKVDREERPDVDKVYMTFVTASSGHGGWPMSVFLTPNLVPIAGGTYFPPEDKYGRPGFITLIKVLSSKSLSGGGGWPMSVWLTPDLKPIYGGTYYAPTDRYYGQPGFASLLKSISHQWNESQDQFKESGDKIMDILNRNTKLNSANESDLPSENVFAKALSLLSRMYEPEYGGFGSAPKFPQPSNFNFLFAYQAIYSDAPDAQKGIDMALYTLGMMDRGGIHDHISQGFARYSTDKRWHVPHFEKMLYDQAQLVLAYLDAFLVSKDSRHAEVVKDIMEYVIRDLSHQKGGFYCAEDADSFASQTSHEKREGAFCVWTLKDLIAVLNNPIKEGSEIKLADVFCFHYSVEAAGNVDPYQDPHDELKYQNVLICHGPIDETAAEYELPIEECSNILGKCRKILYEERQKRPKPHLDDKMLTAWNGMMLAATARAAAVLNDSSYLQRALENAEFIKKYLWNDKKVLLRAAYKGEGEEISLGSEIHAYSDDYAWLIRGLYHLYHATLNEEWLSWAEELQDCQNDLFWDTEGGGYFMGQKGDKSILLRLKDDQDGAEPSVNSVSAGNLIRLSRLLNRQDYEEKAASIFKLFAERLEKVPVALPEMVTSLMLYRNPAIQIILAGDKNSPFLKEMLNAIHSCCVTPNIMILVADRHATDSLLYSRHESLTHYRPSESEELAYVCKDFTCTLPVRTITLLKEELLRNSSTTEMTENM